MKYLKVFLSALLIVIGAAVIITAARGGKPQKIRVLILPKFENGEMKGIFPAKRSITMRDTSTEAQSIRSTADTETADCM